MSFATGPLLVTEDLGVKSPSSGTDTDGQSSVRQVVQGDEILRE
jgi:hypothetical protein